MNNRKQVPRHNRMILLSVTAFLVLAVAVSAGVYTLAKYVSAETSDTPYIAKSFYLESDLLAVETEPIPLYTLQAGVKEISFRLMNYPDELRVSETAVQCEVVLTSSFGEKKQTIALSAGVRDEEIVTFDGLEPGVYTVTVTSTSPYVTRLQGRFTVVAENVDLAVQVNDNIGSPFLHVVVTTTDYHGDVIISWLDGVVPDNTDPLLAFASGMSCQVTVKANSQYTFTFYKNDPAKDYSSQITVTKAVP